MGVFYLLGFIVGSVSLVWLADYAGRQRRKKLILSEYRYLLSHGGGASTLVNNPWGDEADEFYLIWNELASSGMLADDAYSVNLKRTPTGLEIQVR